MGRSRYLTIGVVSSAVILFLFSIVSFSQDRANKKKGGYVGSETCKDCHEDFYKAFKKDTPHWKSMVDPKAPEEKKGCESCHGPGEKHVEAEGKGFVLSFKEDKNAKDRSDACLRCHTKNRKFFQFDRGVHKLSAVGCSDCHKIHGTQVAEKLLKDQETNLCFSCHQDIKSKFYLPVNHGVMQGAVKCTDCHTPHGTRTRASLKKWNKFTNDDVCFKCHAEKRGPWVFEHMPVKVEGCSTCHVAHGSPYRFLLVVPNEQALCLQCHGTRHFVGIAACVNCHTQIHGSNFSSKFFQ